MTAPLAGVRVLDLSRLLPGPFCSMLLLHLGAEVIKVEDPSSGDYTRQMPPLVGAEGAYFLALNRGKRSLAVNLKTAEGRGIFLRLAETADVVLESFRPGIADRLGVGYQAVNAVNPRIVYCSLTGYGQDGPYQRRAGHDVNYMALSGLLGLTGMAGGPPVIPAVQIADLAGGTCAALAIVTALYARERTGRGQYLDVAMLDAVVSWLPLLVAWQAGGGEVARGRLPLSGRFPCYQVYETRDGQFMSLGALEPGFWANFCRLVDREDLIPRQFDGDQATFQEMRAIFRSRTRDEWVKLLEGVDTCCEPVKSLSEALADPQVRHRGMVKEVPHPAAGAVPQLGSPLRLEDAERVCALPAPRLGEHTHKVLLELGYAPEEIEALQARGVVAQG